MPIGPDAVTGQFGLTTGSAVVFCAWHGIAIVPTVTSLNAQEVLVVPLELQTVADWFAASV
jgi:hypothetical protein